MSMFSMCVRAYRCVCMSYSKDACLPVLQGRLHVSFYTWQSSSLHQHTHTHADTQLHDLTLLSCWVIVIFTSSSTSAGPDVWSFMRLMIPLWIYILSISTQRHSTESPILKLLEVAENKTYKPHNTPSYR